MINKHNFILTLFCLLCITGSLSAQPSTPLDTANYEYRLALSKEYRSDVITFHQLLKLSNTGKDKKFIRESFKENQESFEKEILEGAYIFDARFDSVINRVMDRLRVGNSDIPEDLKIYVSRSANFNAASLGDHVLLVNLGAFYYLRNEDQLAALLSHELAHLMQEHQIETLHRYYLMFNKEASAEMRRIKSQRSNRGSQALDRLKTILYSNGNQNKIQEEEADSMGYELYRKAGYLPTDYVRIYDMMYRFDTLQPMGLQPETYRRLFDLPELPFKESWMKQEDFSAYDYSKFKEDFHPDSLKAHPELSLRVDRLRRLFPELQVDSIPSAKPDSLFRELRVIAELERVHSYDFQEEYGIGVYLCLLYLEDDPDDKYYRQWLGHLFGKIYEARKSYTLNRYVDRVDPKEQSPGYQQFLNFIWNLNLKDLEQISAFYKAS